MNSSSPCLRDSLILPDGNRCRAWQPKASSQLVHHQHVHHQHVPKSRYLPSACGLQNSTPKMCVPDTSTWHVSTVNPPILFPLTCWDSLSSLLLLSCPAPPLCLPAPNFPTFNLSHLSVCSSRLLFVCLSLHVSASAQNRRTLVGMLPVFPLPSVCSSVCADVSLAGNSEALHNCMQHHPSSPGLHVPQCVPETACKRCCVWGGQARDHQGITAGGLYFQKYVTCIKNNKSVSAPTPSSS